MSDIDQRLREANGRLKANCFGVSIEKVGNKLFLRATLPPKPKSLEIKPYQQRISISSANVKGVSLAESEAKKLSVKLESREFDWANYINLEEFKQPQSIGEWVKSFERDYFERRERTFKTETTWKVEYHTVFKMLPFSESLESETLRQVILATKPDTRTRKRFCMTLGLLAKFADIEFDPSNYSGNYSPKSRKPRDLPKDKLISEWFLNIDNHKWRWVFGMLATYGLRNHEVFFLDLEELRDGNKVVSVLEGKTGFRQVWPFHPEWFEEFDLASVKIPEIDLNRNNSAIGGTVSQHFRRNQELPFKVYDLRHCYAIRTLDYGIDISLAARQMGHSLAVHSDIYHTWINAQYQQRAFDLAIQKSDRPKPPKSNK
jgi:integrase